MVFQTFKAPLTNEAVTKFPEQVSAERDLCPTVPRRVTMYPTSIMFCCRRRLTLRRHGAGYFVLVGRRERDKRYLGTCQIASFKDGSPSIFQFILRDHSDQNARVATA